MKASPKTNSENFIIFSGKHCRIHFLIKFQLVGLQIYYFPYSCSPVSFVKCLKTLFLQTNYERLLLFSHRPISIWTYSVSLVFLYSLQTEKLWFFIKVLSKVLMSLGLIFFFIWSVLVFFIVSNEKHCLIFIQRIWFSQLNPFLSSFLLNHINHLEFSCALNTE